MAVELTPADRTDAVAPLAAEPAAGAMTNVRWVVCALLFFATTINYIDRQILSLVKESLDRELHWSNSDFGLVNSAFQLTYALSLLGFGWFVDRFGTKIGYAVSIALWSLAAMGHGLVRSVNGFFAARMSLGLGEAGNFPSAIKTVALWFPKRDRALSTSIFNSGANVGAIIAPATVPFVVAAFGWRAAFLFAGIAGLVWLGFWLLMYAVPERSRRANAAELAYVRSDADESAQERRVTWGEVMRYRQAWAFAVAKLLTDPVWWFFLIWLPDYFKSSRGLVLAHSWPKLVTIYGIVTVLSVFGGWLTGFWVERGWTVTRARKTGMFLFAVCALPILAATHVGDWQAVLLIGLCGSAHQAWSATIYTTVSDTFPKPAVASVVGLGGMAGSFGGFIFPYLTGRLKDHFEASGRVTTAYAILFTVCGSAYLVAFALHHLLAPRLEQVTLAPAGPSTGTPTPN